MHVWRWIRFFNEGEESWRELVVEPPGLWALMVRSPKWPRRRPELLSFLLAVLHEEKKLVLAQVYLYKHD